MGVITMGGLTAQPSSRLAHVASMGASSMGAEKAKAEKKERRRSSVKKARFAEEAPPPAPAMEPPKPPQGGGLAGSTFKSRMRDRETRQERARIAQLLIEQVTFTRNEVSFVFRPAGIRTLATEAA